MHALNESTRSAFRRKSSPHQFARRVWAVAALVGLVVVSPKASAQQSSIDEVLSACLESPSGMSTRGQIECTDQSTVAWDRELNRVFQVLMRTLDKPQADALRAAQRQWVKFRDAEIAALGAVYATLDGTMYQVMHVHALVARTRNRAQQLQLLLEDVESAEIVQ